jgi:hypothetical protein
MTSRSSTQGGEEVVPFALQVRLPPEGHPEEGNKCRLYVSRATTASHSM